MKPAHALLVLSLFGAIDGCDRAVMERVQAARRPAFQRTMRAFTDAGRPVWVLAGLGAIALVDRVGGVATARGAVSALVPVNLAVEALKWSVNRTRPDGERKRSNSSFPSSHAANAIALAFVLARRWPRVTPGWFLLAGLVAFSRMYLNRHYLSDVVFGAALGLVLPWLVFRAWPGLDPARNARAAQGSESRGHGETGGHAGSS